MQDSERLRRIARAIDLASRAHEGQRRAHGRRSPYISHVADVARRVSESANFDETTLLAALLHDVVEKTSHRDEEIEREFGSWVAAVVRELTDDAELKQKERVRRQIAGASTLSDSAKRVRLADKASKMAEIAASPPRWWGKGKAKRKIRRAREVVEGLRGADPTLDAAFDREAARAEEKLGGKKKTE